MPSPGLKHTKGINVVCPVLSGEISVLDVLSPEPHPDDVELFEKFRICTRDEYISFLKSKGFFMGGQNNSSTIGFQSK